VTERKALESRDSAQFAVACAAALDDGLRVRFRADGRSMQPNVLDGDVVVVAPISAGKPQRGDIALTRGDGGISLHRVIGWDEATGSIVTRGDAGQQNDAPGAKLLGKVIAIERDGKTVSLTTPGTSVLHAFRRLAHRFWRAGARRAKRYRTAIARAVFILFAFLLHPGAASAQTTLTLTDNATPNPVATGANITYTQTVLNTTATAATGVSITETTPANTLFESMTPPATGWTCGTKPAVGGTGTVTCTANAPGTLAGNASAAFTLVVEVRPEAPGGSTISNTATVNWTGPAGGGTNNGSTSVTVTGADLSMTQAASAAAVAPGGTITYTETVTNNGPNAAVGAVLYQKTPPNTTFASMTPPSGWACGTAPAVGGTGQVICTASANMNAITTTGDFTFVVTVNGGTAAGTTITNYADVTSQTTDPVASNNATITSVLVEISGDSDLAIAATASPTPVFVSSTVTYTIQVTNLGLAAGAGVTVVDTLPPALLNPVATTTAGTCGTATTPPPPSTITCNLGTLAYPLATPVTITITGTTPLTATTLTNTATVSTSGTDPVTTNNSVTVLTVVQPLVCANPGKDGAGGTLNGVVNAYYPPASSVGTVNAGTNSIALGPAAASPAAQTAIGIGDLLLIIQMQGAQINSTNTSSYGSGVAGDPAGSTSLGGSGEFEFVTATSAVPVTGGTLNFTGAGSGGGLLNSYTSAAASSSQGVQTFQVIRVPQYTDATLSSGLTALPWNGATGGVMALDVASQLTLGGTVAMDGLGFRGGGGIDITGSTTGANTDTVTDSPATLPALPPPANSGANGSKGEGIAGTPHWIAPPISTIVHTTTATSTNQTYVEGYPNGSFARGAPGNAGGGATDVNPAANNQNDGGGGGANGGTGGIGGFGWNSAGISGGYGGAAFPATTSALVMGGGGGAGTSNDGAYWNPSTDTGGADCGTGCTGIYSSGAAGAGILIVRTGSVAGSGTVTANGVTSLDQENDGTGGGGAGGTILVFANSGGLSGLTVNAVGGSGGNTWPEQTPGATYPGNRHGPGGGGGGGVVLASSTPASVNVSGGNPGTSTLADDPYGATVGQPGIFESGLSITETPGTQSGAYCAGADLAVTNAGTPNPVIQGNNITYTQTVTNNGPQDAVNASLIEPIPANTTFVSIVVSGAGSAGWTCPAPSGGVITCTNPDVAPGAPGAATFAVVVTVAAATPTGTQITDTVSASSGTNDPNLTNNSATVLTIVGAAGTANLSVTNSGTPNPVVVGGKITYTVVVTNNGPGAASNAMFTETLPANTTFFSAAPTSGTSGWTCTPGTISCAYTNSPSGAPLAAGASTTFTVVVTVTGGTLITDTATVSSSTTDPDPSNNYATVTTVVASSSSQADLAVTKTGTPSTVVGGNNITYTLTVTNNGPGAAATVTMLDTFPAHTTFVSISTVSGWTCTTIAGGTEEQCTNPSVATPSTAIFTLVLNVTPFTAPTPPTPNTITNSVTVSSSSSTTTDPNTANNSATWTTTVSSATQADVAIIKTATPEPVDENTNLTYTLQVTNNGPAVATNVMVSDPLPSSVTFVPGTIQTSQGTCMYTASTTTVTCSLGSISVGGLVIITINVNATTLTGSGSLTSNTATACTPASVNPLVCSTTADPNLSNNSSTALSTIQSPTAVELTSFQAQLRPGGGVLLEWHTREESRNLGFHLYREGAQGRQRIDPSAIAGSALYMRGGLPQHRAKTYQWVDVQGGSQFAYWLEDLDVNGTRTMHGPIYVDSVAPNSEPVAQARLLSQMNQALASSSVPLLAQPTRALTTPRPLIPEVAAGVSPVSFNGEPAVKISVTSEGWYQVSRNQLVAAGLPSGADARTLQLYAEGIEQPMLILGRQTGALGPNDSIEFYGTGIDTPFSGTRVYWLVRGSRPGIRIPSVAAPGSGAPSAPSFPFTVQFEQRTIYFAALLNGENNDNFFGAIVTSDPVDQSIAAANIDPTSSLPVTIAVTLQGVTDQQPHAVSVAFNGAPVGEMDFANQANVTNTFTVTSSLLQNGANTVTLTALAGDNDVNLVQSIALNYAHTYTADSNWLSATASSGDTVRINGFGNGQIQVFDITNPLAISQLTGSVASAGSTFGITLTIPGSRGASHTLLAFSDDQISAPAGLAFHAPNSLERPQAGADLVVISNPEFVASVAPLVKLHETHGDSVSLVTTDQLFDAFNYGERSPYALQNYLQLAATTWRNHPQGVLLIGGASFDPRNYLGFGDTDFVPTRLIETAAFKTASDDWFSDFKQTGFATIPTGRLPVDTPDEAALVVSKIVGYERGTSAGSWNEQALVVADQNVGANFTTAANVAAADLPPSLTVTKILADGQDPAVVTPQILGALNNGSLLVTYLGHGSEEQWSFEDLFDDSTAATLSNGDRLPVYLLMDCLNGFFQDVYDTSLSTSLMIAPNGGAVAVWASSGFTDAAPQWTMNQALLAQWKSDPTLPIAKAILTAKTGIVDADVRRTWNLFGDPLMKLQFSTSTAPGSGPSGKRPH
jgi:uncharacterized repeat protein (TIGR01451 family)